MKKSFSLYEFIIVFGIIAIVTAITIPLISSYSPSLKLSSSAKAVNSKLRQAQEEAVTTQIQHLVRFAPAASPPTLQFIKKESSETVLETVALSQGVTLTIDSSITDNQIIFSADGGPSASGNIIINLSGATKTINISPAGVIKLQ